MGPPMGWAQTRGSKIAASRWSLPPFRVSHSEGHRYHRYQAAARSPSVAASIPSPTRRSPCDDYPSSLAQHKVRPLGCDLDVRIGTPFQNVHDVKPEAQDELPHLVDPEQVEREGIDVSFEK